MKNKSRRLAALLLALVMAGSILSGCGSKEEGPSQEGGTPTTEATKDNKILTIGVSSDIISLDPQAHAHGMTDNLFHNIGSRLVQRGDDMTLVNDLATDYEIVDDTTWKFTIRDDVVFSNGDPLTSADVKYTLERAATDTSLVENNFFKGISGVEILDDHSFYIKTFEAKPDLLSLLAKSGGDIMPAAYIEKVGIEEYIKNPILSGPYVLKEWMPDDHYTLSPNEKFYGVPAVWEEVVVRVIPESSTRVAELLTGGVDLIDNVPTNEWSRIDESGISTVSHGETTRVLLMAVRMTDGYVTADPLVREAIECAIDKNTICNDLLKGAGIPTRTRVGNGVVGFNDDLFGPEKGDLYDPARAKELLAQAGYPDGVDLTLTASKGRYLMDSEIAQMVAAMLGQVGIRVNLEIVEPSVLSDMWSAKENKELIQMGLADNQFDAAYPLIHYGDKDRVAGLTDYDSKECQEIYQKALVNMDLDERAEQMKEIQAIAAADRSHICICQLSSTYGVGNGISYQPRVDEVLVVDSITAK